jgi:type II secretory pathway pseudopilin PulG
MEMLIVVAIIAVLIAIAIPVFTSQLENARDATSVANIRSAYAEAQTAYITKDTKTDHAKYDATEGTVTVKNVHIESNQANDWSGQAAKLPFIDALAAGADATDHGDTGTPGDHIVVFTYDVNGAITKVEIS